MTNPDEKPYITYMELYKKYLQEAEELYQKEDLPQAGEKYYCAVAELLKIIGEKMGMEHKGDKARRDIVVELNKMYPEKKLITLNAVSDQLHLNFYENIISKKEFIELRKGILLFISHLKEIAKDLGIDIED